MTDLLTDSKKQLDLKSLVITEMEGQADCLNSVIEALKSELDAAKMAQAQALHKF